MSFLEFIRTYNSQYKEGNEIYHRLARHYGLSDSAFWILYTLREAEGPVSQKQLCQELYLSKQTVNSALKKLVAEGYLALSSGADQRSKLVQLTPKGEQLACERVDRIPEAEAAALRAMRPKDRAAFICLTRQYRLLLEQQFRESKSKGGTPPEPAAQK